MTRAEILNCLTDRPCEVCKFHESGRCARWDCVFEETPDEMTREEAKTRLIAMKAKFEVLLSMHGLEVSDVFDVAIKALSAIEDIKAEIAGYKDNKIIHAERNEMIDVVLEIMDKHIRGKG